MSGETGGPFDREEWLFAKAPRSLRIEGIERLPELLEALTRGVEEVAVKIHESVEVAKNLATAISGEQPMRPAVDMMAAIKASLAKQSKSGGAK